MKTHYYVKIDDEYREYHTLGEAQDYNDVIQGDGVFFSSEENKTQMIIDKCVERYLQKKSKHIEVKS